MRWILFLKTSVVFFASKSIRNRLVFKWKLTYSINYAEQLTKLTRARPQVSSLSAK